MRRRACQRFRTTARRLICLWKCATVAAEELLIIITFTCVVVVVVAVGCFYNCPQQFAATTSLFLRCTIYLRTRRVLISNTVFIYLFSKCTLSVVYLLLSLVFCLVCFNI